MFGFGKKFENVPKKNDRIVIDAIEEDTPVVDGEERMVEKNEAKEFPSATNNGQNESSQEEKESFKIRGSEYMKLYSQEQVKDQLIQYQQDSSRPFAQSEYYKLADDAQLEVDKDGNILSIENNRPAEMVAMLKELTEDNLELWKGIKHYPLSTAIQVDAKIGERVDMILAQVAGYVGEQEAQELRPEESEKLFDWIKRVMVGLYNSPELKE